MELTPKPSNMFLTHHSREHLTIAHKHLNYKLVLTLRVYLE